MPFFDGCHFGDGTGRNWNSTSLPWPADFGRAKAAAMADINREGQLDIVLSAEHANRRRRSSGVIWLEQDGGPTDTAWRWNDISGVDGSKLDLL